MTHDVSPTSSGSLTRTLDGLVESTGVPGVSIACTLPSGDRFWFNRGHRADAPREPIDNDTLFAVASVTKTITALAVVMLARSAALDLDDPVARWLPELHLPNGAEKEVSIRHLLSHTSGLPGLPFIHGARTPSILRDPDWRILRERAPIAEEWVWVRDVQDLVSALSTGEYALLGAPGTVFNYSNEGFGLLQGVIEAVTKKSYVDSISSALFTPLGVHRFGFTTDDIGELDNIAPLFAPLTRSDQAYSSSPAWWDVGNIYANGSLKTSSAALLEVIDSVMAASRQDAGGPRAAGAEHRLPGLGWDGFRMLTHVEAVLPDDSRYGLGAELAPAAAEHHWFGHGGSIKGTSTHVRAYPDAGLSIVCLINASSAPVTRLVEAIAESVLGTASPARPARVSATDAFGSERPGTYASGELNEIEVIEEADHLLVRRNGGALTPLTQLGRDSFATPDGERCVFLRSGEGAIDSLFMSKRVHLKQDATQDCRPADRGA